MRRLAERLASYSGELAGLVGTRLLLVSAQSLSERFSHQRKGRHTISFSMSSRVIWKLSVDCRIFLVEFAMMVSARSGYALRALTMRPMLTIFFERQRERYNILANVFEPLCGWVWMNEHCETHNSSQLCVQIVSRMSLAWLTGAVRLAVHRGKSRRLGSWT